jgi:hypothetical protein
MGVPIFQFVVPNIEGFKLRIRGIPAGLRDLTDVWPGAVGPLSNMTIGQYTSQGAQGPHGAWAELDPAYAARKRKKYGSKPILQASGKSFAALLSPDAFHCEVRRMSYGVGPEFHYLFYQQTGFRTRLGTGKRAVEVRSTEHRLMGQHFTTHIETVKKAFVEARRVFDPTDRNRQAIQRGLAAALTQKYRRAGYAAWQRGQESSEWPMQGITPGQARLGGIAYYTSLGAGD